MKRKLYIAVIATIATLTGCDSSDIPVQHPDGYDYITFSARTEKLTTRSNPYESYDPEKHPQTMGIFGCYNGVIENKIFDNNVATYSPATTNWINDERKRWDDYKDAKTFDFLAYMPQTTGATVTMLGNSSYKLSIPVSLHIASAEEGAATTADSPFILDTKEAPIICAAPDRKTATTAEGKEATFERVVNMKFDQTLIGYKLLFMLDKKMGAVRNFRIKGVTLSGNIATGGTVERTYTMNNGTWTASQITWTNPINPTTDEDTFAIPYKAATDDGSNDNETKTVEVTANTSAQWGDTFYMIPFQGHQPTIKVTYDVEMKDEDGKTVVTRKDVTSAIVLNKANFSNLANATTAMIYPISILIQPRYLYVMADQDAYVGHLLIE